VKRAYRLSADGGGGGGGSIWKKKTPGETIKDHSCVRRKKHLKDESPSVEGDVGGWRLTRLGGGFGSVDLTCPGGTLLKKREEGRRDGRAGTAPGRIKEKGGNRKTPQRARHGKDKRKRGCSIIRRVTVACVPTKKDKPVRGQASHKKRRRRKPLNGARGRNHPSAEKTGSGAGTLAGREADRELGGDVSRPDELLGAS